MRPVRLRFGALGIAMLLLVTRTSAARQQESTLPSCPARASDVGPASLYWIAGPREDRSTLEQWCRAVGPPFYVASPAHEAGSSPPALENLVVVTWNAHLAEGRLVDLVRALGTGELTNGKPVRHFVLLLQELYRRGPHVPTFVPGVRSAVAIRARDPNAPDVTEQARLLGLSTLYVPSMRNGSQLPEDRGNAIVSTEPLSNAFAVELPLERQRRVAIGASIPVLRDGVASTLRVIDTHLEPLSSPRSLWVFRNPRRRQMSALLDLLSAAHFEDDVAWAGTVLGGDFNTIQGGADESAYRDAKAWAQGMKEEDRRTTHYMGRLDYLLVRLPGSWTAATARVDDKFGSDHHPVLARFLSRAAQ